MDLDPNFQEKKEERLEFLKREEIRTMAKDIARLREIEAQEEREKVAAIAPEERKKPPVPFSPEKETQKKAQEAEVKKISLDTLIPKKPPPRPFFLTKILARVFIVLICLFLVGFIYWFFGIRKPAEEITPPTGETEEVGEEEIKEEKPEIVIPPSLIPAEETRAPEVSQMEEIPAAFSQLMKEEIPEGSFVRIVFKNLEENRPASLEDLALVSQVEVPSEFYSKLEQNFTLFIFSQVQGNRVALVGKVKEKEGLNKVFQTWEDKIEKDGIFLSGKQIPTAVSYFRTAFYQGVGIRYLTISKNDFGICYAQFDDNFVLTTSFEGIKRVIDRIKAEELEKQIGQLFIIGFEGKTVTPELEELFKQYKPGGVLLLSDNIENASQLTTLISDLQALSLRETNFPLFIAVDQEGGLVSRIGFASEKTAQSEIKTSTGALQVGSNRGKELKTLGVNLNLAPLLDLTSSGDFLYERSFQKPATEIGYLAKSLILGQKGAGILTAIKHFPGYGGITVHPENELAIVNEIPEISQFEKAMEANPEFIMTANVIYKKLDPTLPFTFSKTAIQFLKNNSNPEVLIISDDLAQDSLLNKFPLEEIVKLPVEAGVDVLIFSGWDIEVSQGLEAFYTAFKNGEVSKANVETAVSRIIQLKQKTLK